MHRECKACVWPFLTFCAMVDPPTVSFTMALQMVDAPLPGPYMTSSLVPAMSASTAQLGEAQLTITRQSDALGALRAELTDARSALARWEETLVNPDRLEVGTTGDRKHDRDVAALASRIDQYTRALQESHAKLTALNDKHKVRLQLQLHHLC
jgi:small-conductance mechanosensitive channel